MADGLLFVYTDPGPVPAAEFNDWYDNEHGPARLTVPGITSGSRFHALDDAVPPWLAYYEFRQGTLDSPEYRALADNASAREKSIMSSLATLDRRVYELISDDLAPGGDDPPGESDGPDGLDGLAGPPVVLAVSLSVPPSAEADLAAWYAGEHIPALLKVPGWRRVRRYRLLQGGAPTYLALSEVESAAVFEQPAYQASVSTPRRNRLVELAIERERRLFGLHKAFG
jgi:hypothetical protein